MVQLGGVKVVGRRGKRKGRRIPWGLRWSLVVAGGSRPRMRSGDEVWGAEGEERMHEEERNRFCVDTEMGAFLGILLRKIEIFKGSRYCQIPTFSFHINFFETVHTFVK
eukprot:TRINITY_DN7892_c1_g1_i5.p2 TRINITY_DN7892_c1_g1~~TRINITY_DN7892_c1_g1_i5.p2  ORF type:complete len:109 (-),score=20.50 TRINITY_DN7892_c1_g1_i5:142-468(-)